jgi:hypothetical protein
MSFFQFGMSQDRAVDRITVGGVAEDFWSLGAGGCGSGFIGGQCRADALWGEGAGGSRWDGAFLRSAQNLSQEFLERLPIVSFPSRSQDFCLALRKARVVEYDLGPGAMFHELELRN